jgi:Protein of unknown function (DUF3431)
VVITATGKENASWIHRRLPHVSTVVYVANDPQAFPKIPLNKGNEVMVYLTYIIDYYHSLPDVAIFIHGHTRSRHTDELFFGSMVQTISRLKLKKVLRDGYVNLRCNWNHGCPRWLNLQNPAASAPNAKSSEA